MDSSSWMAVYGSLMLAGLAGSLHCVGMCGPILAGFSQVFSQVPLTIGGAASVRAPTTRRLSLLWDFAFYHAGRIWTYAVLGFVAGLAGQSLRASSAYMGWQRPVSIAICAAVILGGFALSGVVPIRYVEGMLTSCGFSRWSGRGWFSALIHGKGATPRLLLGAVMGLLPCGLVYAMLVAVATLPTPWHAALGMAAFGVGTLPSLCAVLGVTRLTPASWRRHGTRLAAVVVIFTGSWMMARTLLASPEHANCPACSDGEARHHIPPGTPASPQMPVRDGR